MSRSSGKSLAIIWLAIVLVSSTIALLAIALRGNDAWWKVLVFVAIVGVAAWGFGAETTVKSRRRTARTIPEDMPVSEVERSIGGS